MIVFVGNKIKLGGLIEVAQNRMQEEICCIGECFNIAKIENDILLKSEGASFIVYDVEPFLNEADEIIGVIKRIQRTNKAKPIILIPTANPKNEIIKCAVEAQIKSFVNTSLSMGEQKDQFEKALSLFFEENETPTVADAKQDLYEENKEIKSFVTELYDAKQREEDRENTVIINRKGTAEVLLTAAGKIFRAIITIVLFILAAIGLSTLIYPEIRAAFTTQLTRVISELQGYI